MPSELEYEFTAALWESESRAGWFFVSLPEAASDEIEAGWGQVAGGFGAVPVEVSIGLSTWNTSVFPSSERGAYVLPVKKSVRTAQNLQEGRPAVVRLRVRAG